MKLLPSSVLAEILTLVNPKSKREVKLPQPIALKAPSSLAEQHSQK